MNLLDNSNFLNPVNQREVTSGTLESTSSYCIDRWRRTAADGTQFAITDSGLTLTTTGNGGIRQLMETQARSDQSFTAAVKLSNGEIIIANGVIGEITETTTAFAQATSGVTTILLQKRILDGLFIVTFNILINTSSVTFEWAALYEGEYTAETLPKYRPKGYATELLECQRYFQFIPSLIRFINVGCSTNTLDFLIPTPNIRSAPTIDMDKFSVRTVAGATAEGFTSSILARGAGYGSIIRFTKANHGMDKAQLLSNGVSVSADL